MQVEDQVSTPPTATGNPEAAAAPGAPTGNLENVSGTEAERIIRDLRAENAKHRTKAKAEESQRLEALQASGSWEKVAKEHAAQLEETRASVKDLTSKLETTAQKAKRWEAYEKAEGARIAAAAKSLSDDDRALLDGVTDLTLRARMLDRLAGADTQAPTEPKQAPPPTGAGSEIDVPTLIKQGWSADRLRATHPAAYEAYLDSGSSRSTTALGDLIMRRK